MKKLIMVLCIILLSFTLTSCFYSKASSKIQLANIQAYDENGNELTYSIIDSHYDLINQYKIFYNDIKKLNSPAPRQIYYEYEIEEESEIEIVITFKVSKGYAFDSVTLSKVKYTEDNIKSIEVNNTQVIVRLNTQLVTIDNCVLTIDEYSAISEEGKKVTVSSCYLGQNTYLEGCYFKLNNVISKFDVLSTCLELEYYFDFELSLLKPGSVYNNYKNLYVGIENEGVTYYIISAQAEKFSIWTYEDMIQAFNEKKILFYYVEKEYKYFYQNGDVNTNYLITGIVTNSIGSITNIYKYTDLINILGELGYEKTSESTSNVLIYEKHSCYVRMEIENDGVKWMSISFE